MFCAVLAFCRVRFVRFADNERADTTMRLLAECFEVIGGVPKVVLIDRMGCVKGRVVADVVIPTPDYVRFAAHYRFRPDFCQARDPQSKGIVENLVGYAKRDLMVGLGAGPGAAHDLAAANTAAELWCEQVNKRRALADRCCPRSASGRRRARAARRVAVAGARRAVRRPAGAAQGRQVVLCPVRLGSLLGA